jgi:hypothetical protein
MKWAVEIKQYGIEHRNLQDLLKSLGFQVVESVDSEVMYSPIFDDLETAKEVWDAAKKVRDAFTGSASIDPNLVLGPVINYRSNKQRHFFLEVDSVHYHTSFGSPTLTVSPPVNLSAEEQKKWEEARTEEEYRNKLETQKIKLVPAYLEPRASKVLSLLSDEEYTGESLYKIYELMEFHPSNRKNFQQQFNILKTEFQRFSDAVHNPVVSGDLARHAYEEKPKTSNPMTLNEANSFIQALTIKWLASIRDV